MMEVVTDKSNLRKICSEASIEESHKIGKILLEEMFSHNGLGLAAPQLGFDARVFAVKYSGQQPFDKACYFINPKILDKNDPVLFTEGCLSIPGKFVDKIRFNKILISDELNKEPYWIEGLPAIIWQHENDHLNGILMDDESFNPYVLCPCGSGRKFKFCHMKNA